MNKMIDVINKNAIKQALIDKLFFITIQRHSNTLLRFDKGLNNLRHGEKELVVSGTSTWPGEPKLGHKWTQLVSSFGYWKLLQTLRFTKTSPFKDHNMVYIC